MESIKLIAIYELYNEDLTIRYIGYTVGLRGRFYNHRKTKRPWAIGIRVLEWVEEKDKRAREKHWIALYKSLGFVLDNENNGGSGVGTPEARRKLSLAHTGKKLSPEHRKAISEGNKKRWENGAYHSEEALKKMSLARINNPKIPIPKGTKLSEDHRQRIKIGMAREEVKMKLKLRNNRGTKH